MSLEDRTAAPPPPPAGPEKQWHYAQAGKVTGPLPESEIRKLLSSLPSDVLVWRQGLNSWVPPLEAGLKPPDEPESWELVGRPGTAGGVRVTLSGRVRIGRSAECEVQLQETRISRVHASIEQRSDGYWISDNHSLNGTHVNGIRITEPVRLTAGALIRICDSTLIFQRGSDAPAFDPDKSVAVNRDQVFAQPPPTVSAAGPTCHRCQATNRFGVRFCEHCGQKLV